MELGIEIGGIPIGLSIDNSGIYKKIIPLYAPFKTRKKVLYRIQVQAIPALKQDSSAEVFISFSRGIYRVITSEFSGYLDLRNKNGLIQLGSKWLYAALSTAITNICMFLTLQRKGIILHSSGVVKNNRAFLFFGPSGAGKSTVVRNSTRALVLSEELIGINLSEKTIQAFGFPYPSDRKFSLRTNRSFAIRGLFRLVQDNRNYIRKVLGAYALADFFMLPIGLGKFINIGDYARRYETLVSKVPCYELHFLPDGSFWRCIDALPN